MDAGMAQVGRTARAGAKGRALTFIEDDDRQLLKEVIKRTGVQMQQRQVPAATVTSWQHRVEKLEPQVAAIILEEREERALRKAEMEAQKAANMLEHEDEIRARPARTWFQTEHQKRELAQRSKAAAAAGEEGEEGGDDDDMTNKQRKNKAKNERRAELKQQRAKEAKEAAKKKSNKLMEETAGLGRSIKAVKAREQQLRLEGMTGGKVGKVAASLVTGVKRKKQKKGKAKGAEGGGSKELFSGDGLPSKPAAGGGSKVYAGGARSQKVKAPRKAGGLSKTELNRQR
ncbi:DEAD-box ATP-dependent RNA helicase 28 [Chlorella sorokiniana]|uniref:DEAD-box ATP-dependent RNA helicase 28 n=1 Tax=Chlorella sorokiniana TaxID=3076 RepID=A0A2P6TMS0_CHLSO|nr:DEAD-box ATP-dependent RNA helicase 28 [Chlorella sorokiniana]|eukprot:PRW45622.1 DEAD-box ATP-dependent RNA helicase 28 [Chlorella sorokiniana]